jgi:GAF domain-containing protein
VTANGTPGQEATGPETSLAELLRALPGLLEALPERHATAERVMAELADVQVAQEELRVAEEELRVQQEQISDLLQQHDADRRWRGQLTALVPVGLCVTDGAGAVLDANAAMAAHLGTGPQRLRGKPLSVYLDPQAVHAFRDALRMLASGASTERRLSLSVVPRHMPPYRAHLFGFTETADHRATVARIQWVLLPEGTVPENGRSGALVSGVTPTGGGDDLDEHIPSSQVIALATSLAELSSMPIGEPDRQRLLSRMATLVTTAVPGADWVSITMGSPMDPQRLGSDSTEAQEFDGRQLRAAEGPCWEAYTSGKVVIADDVRADGRWPTLARTAGYGAVRSVLALPVQEDGTSRGVINVYSGQVGAFGPAGRRIAELVAAAVAGVLQNVAERESLQTLATNLERALSSRAVIDQAKGVIMARLNVDADNAFARLVNVSSRLNVKVRDLAALVVEGHVDAVLRAAE